jgi:branched-subunit amino acid aminotransferase/4-amino-4-deoxychorismate lyase
VTTVISVDGTVGAAQLSVLDRGLLYGDGVFEVLRTWDGVPVSLDAHLDRLYASAAALELFAMPRLELRDSVLRTLAAAGADPEDKRIRIMVTRGPGGLGTRLAELGRGHAIVIVEPLPAQPKALALAVVDWPLPRRSRGHKTLAYLDHILARELAAAAGADEAARLGPDGEVVEGATSNLFVVLDGRVITPSRQSGALPGITRARVLELCAELGIAASEDTVRPDTLRAADEIFATSSLRGVVPVTLLDGEPRAAGPVTARLAAAYERSMRMHAK